MKKSRIAIAFLVLAVSLLTFTACSEEKETFTVSDFQSAVADLQSYTLTTTVTADNGIFSKTIEEVTVNNDKVDVSIITITPNEIGAKEQYSTTIDNKSYPIAEFQAFHVSFSLLQSVVVIDNNGALNAKIPKIIFDEVCGITAEVKTDVSLNVSIDKTTKALTMLTITYSTQDDNNVSITVVPKA